MALRDATDAASTSSGCPTWWSSFEEVIEGLTEQIRKVAIAAGRLAIALEELHKGATAFVAPRDPDHRPELEQQPRGTAAASPRSRSPPEERLRGTSRGSDEGTLSRAKCSTPS